MNDLFDDVIYAGIDTDKHKYPIGKFLKEMLFTKLYLFDTSKIHLFASVFPENITSFRKKQPNVFLYISSSFELFWVLKYSIKVFIKLFWNF